MKIGIITYDIPHLKTQEIIYRLHKKGYKISIFITRFKKIKKRLTLYNHRPNQFFGLNPYELSKKLKIKNYKLNDIKKFEDIKYFLVGGCGIIKKRYIVKDKIINCHPGLIPLTRGLDSFKWSILNNNPIGNSLHFIDESIDNGKIISHKLTPIFKNDYFETLSNRHYKMEIDMLVNFEKYLKKPIIFKFKQKEPKKRMPISEEKKLLEKFNKIKQINLKKSSALKIKF